LLVLRTRGGKDDVLTPVEWGARQYLVRDLLGFVNNVNAGIEPRTDEWGAAFLRVDDWKKKADGPPSLPPPWDKRLLSRPIEGKVVEVLPGRKATRTDLERSGGAISLGTADGVFVGMVLWTDNRPKPGSLPLTVVSVEKSGSVVETVYGRFAVGEKITSLRPKP
jgi:hypothetical protein